MLTGKNDVRANRRAQGALESEVLATLWAEERPMTAGEVKAVLGDQLAYNTVQTTLTRLLNKGLVRRQRSGRAHAYQPTSDQAVLTAQRMVAHLEPGANHATVLAQFLTSLNRTDAAVLRELLTNEDYDDIQGDSRADRTVGRSTAKKNH